MGCCSSSPHERRRYLDPADLDEEYVNTLPDPNIRLRTFGRYRPNQVFVPDDIDGLPSSRIRDKLATSPDTLLYTAEIDNGMAWRCVRPCWIVFFQILLTNGCKVHCDEMCCWLRKEYSSRTYYRVYANRIEINNPSARVFGMLGCGSWAADHVLSHPFDRGAFGFRRVPRGVLPLVCCVFPMFGDVVARQRCQCNGPLWYSCTDGWWCDEWPCDMMCCTYRYQGLADGDESAMASSLALQAYFEGRSFTQAQMEQCLQYWRDHVSEMGDPVHRKRPVLCQDTCSVPSCVPSEKIYQSICQCPRKMPPHYEPTPELQQVYDQYETQRQRQIKLYKEFKEPVRLSTWCRKLACQRCFGRKGVVFCTEGCCCEDDNTHRTMGRCYSNLKQQALPQDDNPPFAPYSHADWDDDHNAATILQQVLGNPPPNVVYRKWQYDPDTKQHIVVQSPSIVVATNSSNNDKNYADNGHYNQDDQPVVAINGHPKNGMHHRRKQQDQVYHLQNENSYEVVVDTFDDEAAGAAISSATNSSSEDGPHPLSHAPCTLLKGDF
ncbi:expressed unknown protein [Seminavis robusta]|uniref:Uncharacterized protein n=1 Tax=Seminavis robusta TaxID=568900 RepID=A0A9N8F1Y0_9STRA|nr:expressed unknown protein [Seminavis robusta]|eukprot:Sro2403_g326380.1 n/a (549) ;mRNA; f:1292-2938